MDMTPWDKTGRLQKLCIVYEEGDRNPLKNHSYYKKMFRKSSGKKNLLSYKQQLRIKNSLVCLSSLCSYATYCHYKILPR